MAVAGQPRSVHPADRGAAGRRAGRFPADTILPAWPKADAFVVPRDSAAVAAYPTLPYRLMAAFRIWAVGQYFFPYRDLTGEPWDRVLTGALPRLEAAGRCWAPFFKGCPMLMGSSMIACSMYAGVTQASLDA